MIHGKNNIGFELSAEGIQTFKGFNPKANTELPELFYAANLNEIEKTVVKARKAYEVYKNKPGKEKAAFLRTIADKIEALDTVLIERAMLESGLPAGRITGERGRTCNQLRLFAALLEEGSWCKAVIDLANLDRKPAPKPDIRKVLRPVGPVVVFPASNFPLAFSTAGGDTASALASGCTVIVKAHPYHPGTNELVASAILAAADACSMPDGVFSSLHAPDHKMGQALVMHPLVKSVAFTGSFSGGKMLYDLAQKREEPIPIFAEMGSVNPIILLPGRLKEASAVLAEQIAGSITLGAGQFCTNPGVIVSLAGEDTDDFLAVLSSKIKDWQPETMLHPNIKQNFALKTSHIATSGVPSIVAQSEIADAAFEGRPIVAKVSARSFIANPNLAEEIFGPFSLIVECANIDELHKVVCSFKGQLTATIMGNNEDVRAFSGIISDMQEVVGRLIFNGVPTGVEVCYAMQHGGPFPASTDARFTSVGTGAIKRFVRPVAFQDAPESYLPDELKNANPLNIWRLVDGVFMKEKI